MTFKYYENYKLFIRNSITAIKGDTILDNDWNIPSYTISFLGQSHVNQLKAIWTNKIPLKNELNTEILDFMVKKKKNILGKERQEISEFIKKKKKKVPDKEIDEVFESINNVINTGHSLILGCQKCKKGILSFKKWFNEPYGIKKEIIYMNEETVLRNAFKKDNLICPSCNNKIHYFANFDIYEVKKNYSVNHYYIYKKP